VRTMPACGLVPRLPAAGSRGPMNIVRPASCPQRARAQRIYLRTRRRGFPDTCHSPNALGAK
jgi:hypothetical protein